ncbi:hypothetical protein YYC_00586 [Plasmodium yoelii 17X]|uniref:Uncharacterized protein n=3 Tax=Plasmodium yoelii TaxID=5861 RepID=A0AAE9WU10_PLAYO|nr:conserved Plasmodium protein, unknown function [Plasmodium yoelii]ETB62977.1 hypothetical protein YYC_00586 [Plasmodium yoelii 17X]WBY60101.1 hypothetical protein Py17XNL_001303254 [Plasmodium yoelii yoelii]CDU20017.1 conserved Plasmodium protein, unknown function [Plasmodium yoelii]VTZ80775.1 conserved Plasmodium protein, unknown function [Plasmodium yoelii]|eukprot:XP_022813642.1 conserved Plasmodium protein, unknown function [Plasmodium yoelii]
MNFIETKTDFYFHDNYNNIPPNKCYNDNNRKTDEYGYYPDVCVQNKLKSENLNTNNRLNYNEQMKDQNIMSYPDYVYAHHNIKPFYPNVPDPNKYILRNDKYSDTLNPEYPFSINYKETNKSRNQYPFQFDNINNGNIKRNRNEYCKNNKIETPDKCYELVCENKKNYYYDSFDNNCNISENSKENNTIINITTTNGIDEINYNRSDYSEENNSECSESSAYNLKKKKKPKKLFMGKYFFSEIKDSFSPCWISNNMLNQASTDSNYSHLCKGAMKQLKGDGRGKPEIIVRFS